MVQPNATDERALERDTLAREVERRRTFAIISHPDAGKTTLTEKLLLYAGAIELAGAVRGRKTGRHATSDWMEIEQQRGISISAAALEFELKGHHVTLLDTPGHQDFSEDTYRTLLAVDSVVMVLDAAKGIETQTLKLFEVCRTRRLPVLTFINKLDQPSKDPFELMDEIERVLGVAAAPMNWPLGDGVDFRGVYDLETHALILYERQKGGTRNAPVAVTDPADPRVGEMVGERRQRELIEAVEIISGAGTRYDEAAYRAERQTPVFFGSALERLRRRAVPQRAAVAGAESRAPAERDRRSGRADRSRPVGIRVQDPGKHEPASPRPRRLLPDLLRTADEGHGGGARAPRHDAPPLPRLPLLRPRPRDRARGVRRRRRRPRESGPAGDRRHALCRPAGAFSAHPAVPGRTLRGAAAWRRAAQALRRGGEPAGGGRTPPGLHAEVRIPTSRSSASSGALQFDVIAARLQSEYGIQCTVDQLSFTAARWPVRPDGEPATNLVLPLSGVQEVKDRRERDVVLFASDWELRYCADRNPGVEFRSSM